MDSKYSVLMSVYYKEKPEYLKIAIQSMLDQTVKPNEFIIIKDGPLTEELDLIISYFIRNNNGLFTIIRNEQNLGLGPSLRKGIDISRNNLIVRMDSDDYSDPRRCEMELKILEKNSSLGMVGTWEAEFFDDIANVISIHKVPENQKEILKFMRRRCAILHPTVIFKKNLVIKAGNYQAEPIYDVYEDYDLFARMIFDENVQCYNIQEPLYYIRTTKDFYKRRGGIKYAKTALRFKYGLFRKGNISVQDFIISGFGQAVVCLLPNTLRKIIYLKFLR